MATVVAGLSMSLDGFIAHPDDGVQHLFGWYDNGAIDIHWPGNDMASHAITPSVGAEPTRLPSKQKPGARWHR
jgi:hypothetical protein